MNRIEYEFGVAIPGVILPPERWTRCGWKDDGLPFDWEARFGRSAPRIVDFGCGNGRYLLGSALARPDHDHLGIDIVQPSVDYAAQRAKRRGLTNVRFAKGDAVVWAHERLASDSLDEVHIYHPQPYYEADAPSKRLLNAEYFERLWTLIRKDGLLVLQTDNKAYWNYLLQAAARHFDPRILAGPWPDAPEGRTRREIVARQKGLTVWRMEARRREQLAQVDIPRPDFDANRPRFKKR